MLADEKIREQALEPDRSFIVQAPAGSGKTGLVIQRYLKLLGRANFPEEILAMTFTRKAAAEMKERILAALAQAQTEQRADQPQAMAVRELAQKVLAQNRARGWQLMTNPARLRIVTIDSFCSSLTRRMPLLSGMGPGLDVQENSISLYRETAKNVMALTENATSPYGELVRNILRHVDNSKSEFINRIVQLLTKRDQWMISFFDPRENLKAHLLTEDDRKKLEQAVANLIQSRLDKLQNLFAPKLQQKILKLANYAAENLERDDPSHQGAGMGQLQNFPSPTVAHLKIWKGLAHLFLTGENTYRKRVDKWSGFPAAKDAVAAAMKDDFRSVVDSLQKQPTLLSILAEVKELPRSDFSAAEWDLLKSAIRLLPEINTSLKNIFSAKETTDFTEISLAAINGLVQTNDDGQENPTDLLFYLDCKIHHILVDEYQDTSYKQEELLRKLTSEWSDGDGKTLFIVGDPKQSIYRFRDAEVGLFTKTQSQRLGSLRLKTLSLKSNFRSQKNLVDWVNACFQKIFPHRDDPDLGAISYAESSAVLPEDIHPGVVYHPIRHEDSHAVAEEEARQITVLVDDLQTRHPDKSVAILVRGRTHLASIVKHLHKSNIAFRAKNIDSLTDRSAILDLFSLLKALRFHGDRTAWLSILRAPWCGLSLADIHALVERDSETPVWSLLKNPARIELLSEDGNRRAQNFICNVRPFVNGFADKNFRDILEACWISLGGPACLLGTSPDDIEVFFNKVEELIESGQEEQFENFDQILKNLYASPLVSDENAVQIMTMHNAKGLEFDFVILPGLGKHTKADERRLIYWMRHGDDLLLAPIEKKGGSSASSLYKFLSGLDKEKDGYETLRLLYVAATRAKTQLHLFGHLRFSEKEKTWKPDPQSLLNKLWPHVKKEWLEKLHEVSEPSPVESDATTTTHSIRRLPVDFSLPVATDSIVEGQVIDVEDEKYIAPEYHWAGNSARCLGNVLHRCLQNLAAEKSKNVPDKKIIENLRPKLLSALLGEGLPLDSAKEAAESGVLALTNTLEDERGLWILAPHDDAHSEYPLTFLQDNRYVRNVIDRTFVDEGVRWIIDYKTGTHKGEGKNLEIFLENEVERYRHQLDRYETVLRKYGEERPIKKALYFPLLKEWREIN